MTTSSKWVAEGANVVVEGGEADNTVCDHCHKEKPFYATTHLWARVCYECFLIRDRSTTHNSAAPTLVAKGENDE